MDKLSASRWRLDENLYRLAERFGIGYSTLRAGTLMSVRDKLVGDNALPGVNRFLSKLKPTTLDARKAIGEEPATLFRGHIAASPALADEKYHGAVHATPFLSTAIDYGKGVQFPGQPGRAMVSTYKPKPDDVYYADFGLRPKVPGNSSGRVLKPTPDAARGGTFKQQHDELIAEASRHRSWWDYFKGKKPVAKFEANVAEAGLPGGPPLARQYNKSLYETDVAGRQPTNRYLAEPTGQALELPFTPANDSFIREIGRLKPYKQAEAKMNGFMAACLEMLGTKTADEQPQGGWLGAGIGGLLGAGAGAAGGHVAVKPFQAGIDARKERLSDNRYARLGQNASKMTDMQMSTWDEHQRLSKLAPSTSSGVVADDAHAARLENAAAERRTVQQAQAARHADLRRQAFGSAAIHPPGSEGARADLAQDIVSHRRANPARTEPTPQQEMRQRYESGRGTWSPQVERQPLGQRLPLDMSQAMAGAQSEKRMFRQQLAEQAQGNAARRLPALNDAYAKDRDRMRSLWESQSGRYRGITGKLDNMKSLLGRTSRGVGGLMGGLVGGIGGNVLQHWLSSQKQGSEKQAANPNMLRQGWDAVKNFGGWFARKAAPHAYNPNPAMRATVGGIAGQFAGGAMGDPTGFNVGGGTDPNTGKNVGGMRINPLGIAAGAGLGYNATSGKHLATAFNTGMGAMMGNETGNAMAPGLSMRLGGQVNPETGKYEGGHHFNPLGVAGGVMMGNRRLAGTSVGRSLERPLMGAWRGAMTGGAADYAAGQAAGVDTKGWGATAGGWGGLAAGAGSNRFLNQRDAIIRAGKDATNTARQNFGAEGALANVAADTKAKLDALKGSWSGTAHRLNNAGEQAYHGEFDPLMGGLRRAGNWFAGAKDIAPAMPKDPMAFAGRRMGQVLGGVGLATGVGGLAYNAATSGIKKHIGDAYKQTRQQAEGDMDQYLRSRGFMNQKGQFDPTQGIRQSVGQHFVDPFLQMLGHDPAQMSGGQKAMHMAGPAMAAGGAFMGNPWMTAGGVGAMAYPHMNGQHYQQPGQQPQQGQPFPWMRPPQAPNTPQARNELEAQQAKQMSHATGQGYL